MTTVQSLLSQAAQFKVPASSIFSCFKRATSFLQQLNPNSNNVCIRFLPGITNLSWKALCVAIRVDVFEIRLHGKSSIFFYPNHNGYWSGVNNQSHSPPTPNTAWVLPSPNYVVCYATTYPNNPEYTLFWPCLYGCSRKNVYQVINLKSLFVLLVLFGNCVCLYQIKNLNFVM